MSTDTFADACELSICADVDDASNIPIAYCTVPLIAAIATTAAGLNPTPVYATSAVAAAISFVAAMILNRAVEADSPCSGLILVSAIIVS